MAVSMLSPPNQPSRFSGENLATSSSSWSLKESVRYDAQRVQTRSWADYPILTFPEVPAVEVVLLNRPEEKSLGAGEGSQGPTVAAIANAIAHATGKRMRDLPFTRERVKAVLA